MRKLSLIALLLSIAISCSGCTTILGGIIGYQSGEAVAGAAIGAAIDIASAISHDAQQKEEREEREIQRKEDDLKKKEAINIYAEDGYIRIGSILAQGRTFSSRLQNKFDNFGWQYYEDDQARALGDEIARRVFHCTTTDEKEFELTLIREKDQDVIVLIEPKESDNEFQSMITSQIGVWIQDITGQ